MSYTACKTKKDRIQNLKSKLTYHSDAAIEGLLLIFSYQTAEEQDCESVLEDNGIGFTGADGSILSSFARQVTEGRTLSDKQMDIIHKKMPKYAAQLERLH